MCTVSSNIESRNIEEVSFTNTYVCIDLETTGLHPKQDRIIEIGAVKVRDGKVQDTYASFVHPGRKLTERIIGLTGIRDEMLADAPSMDQIFPELLEFLEDLPLLGHRILFDYSFLKKAAVDRKVAFEKSGMDTLQIARRCLPWLEHKSLPYLCGHFGMDYSAHRALEDAWATHTLYQTFVRDYAKTAADLLLPRKLVYQVKRDVPVTKVQLERLSRLLSLYQIEPDFVPESLTRSEADRKIDRILAEYGRK